MLESVNHRDNSCNTASLERAFSDCVQQLITVIDEVPDEVYVAQSPFMDSSIGKHMRHIIEFMQLLGEQTSLGSVDYELRQRVIELEQSRTEAKKALGIHERCIQQALKNFGVNYQLIQWQTPHRGANKIALSSTLGREIMYVIEHAIHHQALIKILALGKGIQLREDIGLSVATEQYLEKENAHKCVA